MRGQEPPIGTGRGDEDVGLGHGQAHGFLDDDVLAGPQHRQRQRGVQARRGGHDDHLGAVVSLQLVDRGIGTFPVKSASADSWGPAPSPPSRRPLVSSVTSGSIPSITGNSSSMRAVRVDGQGAILANHSATGKGSEAMTPRSPVQNSSRSWGAAPMATRLAPSSTRRARAASSAVGRGAGWPSTTSASKVSSAGSVAPAGSQVTRSPGPNNGARAGRRPPAGRDDTTSTRMRAARYGASPLPSHPALGA